MAGPSPILVLTTGGTIDKQYFDALSEYQIRESTVARLLEIARVTHPFRTRELMRKDSLELTDEDRQMIRQAVADAEESRIVITHGTDTMAQTAQDLSGIEGKTIVLTGALAPARFIESDAAFNVGMAFACCQAAQPGIYITMNGSVFDGLHVAKDRERGSFVTTTD
ncbi:L-asparaginase [Altererythrobacter atlanticus]|uniref:L-asparaginase 1 n=1 Tax=Croceibacterium atlanticum TaxID=1267766 RepID=A0A0F7KXZ5_9SPHN|nr:asparaginase domain-containing protein [Croceibacterium atlanticum]AKH44116.1 L-asparaginase 1 [Croceibacterium atlanticum]MBB5732426.1 L-asparaginase [Croceibacterium atlanticum]